MGAERALAPSVVLADPKPGTDRVALIDVRGMLMDAARPDLFGTGVNPVDRFVAALELAEQDPTVRAVILRITSPGGTVTASDIMYTELRRFEQVTHKPVVASLGEVAASGGYYLAIGSDRIVAQPTSITGSIGVIMPTVNISEGLAKIGVHSRSIKSAANKDLANPLEPMRDSQYSVLQGLVDEYFARFKGLVLERRTIKPENVAACTDGRVFSGEQAVAMGLADEVGGVREAFAAAKKLAGIHSATLVKYSDSDRPARTAYTLSPVGVQQASNPGLNLHLDTGPALGQAMSETSGVYYLWLPTVP